MPKIKTIRKEGGSKIMTVTDIIPSSWLAVIVVKSKQKNETITLIIEKVR